ncbi:MAG: MerR family transcriptional regulator, partial [Acidimicrobiales bacterium]
MADAHLSIGEVLALLQEEFPDVTISKIRFLESQGLIDPERTPSGYRKFYAADIDRLRWILVQQRENFLPLKVIKDRLESADGIPADEPAPVPAAVGEGGSADGPA